ncbi:hypothetical protein [Paraflavitalea sp. CAU 1676]|uniref:hypothetical protein n=1 Tax=Paraflavitalea sp. CAU 1676 TaxID=3032598 RepID=UPI0023DA9256|nr:hypothetical protein [Paraflavitalea sp. CAU 1676]MDF2193167.1 hypothetical protein [Paraflavitalea sp. CAU 1676]
MKNRLPWVIAAMLCCTACHKSDDTPLSQFSTNKTGITLQGYIDALDSISITSDGAWSLSTPPSADWLQVSSTKGSGSATVYVKNNKEIAGTAEEVTLTITSADQRVPATSIKINRTPYFKKVFSQLASDNFHISFNSGVATTDGGVIMVGTVFGTIPGRTEPQEEGIIARFNSAGALQWKKLIGGSKADYLNKIVATSDGNYMIAGNTRSNDGTIENGNKGNFDYWITRINDQGIIAWSRTYGGSGIDAAQSIAALSGGKCFFTGYSSSAGGQVGGSSDVNNKAWNIIVAPDGDLLSGFTIGETGNDLMGRHVIPTNDGKFLLIGNIGGGGPWRAWMAKCTPEGTILWQQTHGGYNNIDMGSGVVTNDGGYLVAGKAYNQQTESMDILVIKTNAEGNQSWQKLFGGNMEEQGGALAIAPDGAYYLVATTQSNDATVPGHHGGKDAWLLQLNAQGNKQWAKALGGTLNDYANTIIKTTDNKYLMGGTSTSNDGDLTGNGTFESGWILKFE